MRFPYIKFPAKPDAAFPNRRFLARPMCAIALAKNNKRIISYAVVDSGADTCIFPASLAGQIGIAIPNQNSYVFSGSSDKPQIAYFETIQVTLWNGNENDAPLKLDLYAGFCDTMEHTGIGLLGQDGFFSRFEVTLNHAQSFFAIKQTAGL